MRNPGEVIAEALGELHAAMLVTVMVTMLDASNRDLFDKLHYRFNKRMDALKREAV